RGDDDVAATRAVARRVGGSAATAHRTPGGKDARSADLAEPGALLLRQRPRAVLEDLDGDAGSDAEMEVELAVKIFQMTMAVDEARQHRLAGRVDDLGIGRNGHIAALSDRFKPSAADDDHRIPDRWTAGAVDQLATPQCQHFVSHPLTPFSWRL